MDDRFPSRDLPRPATRAAPVPSRGRGRAAATTRRHSTAIVRCTASPPWRGIAWPSEDRSSTPKAISSMPRPRRSSTRADRAHLTLPSAARRVPSLSPPEGRRGQSGTFDSLSAPGGGEGRGEVGDTRALADVNSTACQKERPAKAARLKEKEAVKGGPPERKGGRQRRPRG